VARAQKQQLLT